MDDEVAQPDPEPSPPSVQAPEVSEPELTPASEEYQRLIDEDTIAKAIGETRSQLSALKISYWLARSGLKVEKHPSSIVKDIAEKRRWIDTLTAIYKECRDSGLAVKEPLPEPPAKLEVVGGHLNQGINTP